MTPHEKAVSAVNARLQRLQAELRNTQDEAAQRYLLQAVFVTIAVIEALNDYIKSVGAFAQRRHAELKEKKEALELRHSELLEAGKAQLEKLKANPLDKAVTKEIERTQALMAAVQKDLKRGANTLQHEVAPGLAMIDQMSDGVRRLAEADKSETLKRLLRMVVEKVGELYRAQPDLPEKEIVDAEAWETTALGEVEAAAGFTDAYAHSGYQTTLSLELMAMALSETPPATPGEASQRARTAVTVRLKEITERFAGGS